MASHQKTSSQCCLARIQWGSWGCGNQQREGWDSWDSVWLATYQLYVLGKVKFSDATSAYLSVREAVTSCLLCPRDGSEGQMRFWVQDPEPREFGPLGLQSCLLFHIPFNLSLPVMNVRLFLTKLHSHG